MKFRINAEQFNRAVAPAADVALKNVVKDKENGEFYYAYILTIEASSRGVQIYIATPDYAYTISVNS